MSKKRKSVAVSRTVQDMVRCLNCRWFVPGEECGLDAEDFEEGVGICHRYPPSIDGSAHEEGEKCGPDLFPIVHEEYWCGEFKR